ncbi:MAG: hypothetical protein K8823_215 [Cenarchaeum symbiont of Oopsacas minuta]|nr:hypothetical protein [Cenarchaeum symbiont of Oopsacas minuta]
MGFLTGSRKIYTVRSLCHNMNIEYEEFENVEDLFMYLVAAASPMKNTMPVTVYKGNVMSFIPLSPTTGDSYLVLYVKNDLESGIYEFDMSTREYKKVKSIERADKAYFICIKPKRNTLAEIAMANL